MIDEDSVKSAMKINLDTMTDAEIEQLYKRILERLKKSKISNKENDVFNSLKTDSDM